MENTASLFSIFLPLLLDLIVVILFVTVAVGLIVKGPARWVKISTVLLILIFLAAMGLHSRSWKSLYVLVFVLLCGLAGMCFAILAWRHPYRKEYLPAAAEDCPAYAGGKFGKLSGELERLGFQLFGHRLSKWKAGRERSTFTSFFKHGEEPFWFELHALSSPKMIARVIVTDKGEGRSVQTMDQQSDVELFGDELTSINRVKRSSTCAEMLESHRAIAMKGEGTARKADAPDKASLDLVNGMFERLVGERRLVRKGENWVAVPIRGIPQSILRALSAWFH